MTMGLAQQRLLDKVQGLVAAPQVPIEPQASRPRAQVQAPVPQATEPPPGWAPDALPNLASARRLGYDLETTGIEWWRGHRPVGVAVAAQRDDNPDHIDAWYLPTGHVGGNHDPEQVLAWARSPSGLAGKHLFGLNVPFDAHHSREWGLGLEALGCTLGDIGHRAALLDDHRQSFSLESIAQDLLGEGKVKGLDMRHGAGVYHAHQVTEYARQDARLVLRCLAVQEPLLAVEGLGRVVALEDATIWPVLEMERNAIPLDLEKLDRWVADMAALSEQLAAGVRTGAGFPVNPDSPEDMARLWASCGLKLRHTAKGAPSFTEEIVLEAAAAHPLIAQAWRAGKVKDLHKVLAGYQRKVSPDGRLRFALNQLKGERDEYGAKGTVSGRFSASAASREEGDNPQQVLAWDKYARTYLPIVGQGYYPRELFVPGPGATLCAADAKQIEFRIFAHYSKSASLLAAYAADPETDFHNQVTEMAHATNKTLTRKQCKFLNFALIFAAGRKRGAAMMECSLDDFDSFLAMYRQAFPEAQALLHQAQRKAKERKWVKTALGRRARFKPGCMCGCRFKRKEKDNREPEPPYHKALNAVIQGTAADLNKLKLCRLYAMRHELGFTMRLTVHDEVVGDLPDAEAASRLAAVLAVQEVDFKVPILWDLKTGPNWAACK